MMELLFYHQQNVTFAMTKFPWQFLKFTSIFVKYFCGSASFVLLIHILYICALLILLKLKFENFD